MRNEWIVPVLGLLLFTGAYAATGSQKATQPAPKVDREAIAERLTTQCAGIHEGDLVVISGGPRELDLLEDVATHVGKRGAFPLLLMGSDRLTRRLYDDVPAQYDTRTPLWNMGPSDFRVAENGGLRA